jgi:hypothetical protein
MVDTVLLLINVIATPELIEKLQTLFEQPVDYCDGFDIVHDNKIILKKLETLRKKYKQCVLVSWDDNDSNLLMRVSASAALVWQEVPQALTFYGTWEEEDNVFNFFSDDWYFLK